MPITTMLRILRERWTAGRPEPPRFMEPLDHPSLRGMSLRQLADLPLEPPPAPAPPEGAARRVAAPVAWQAPAVRVLHAPS